MQKTTTLFIITLFGISMTFLRNFDSLIIFEVNHRSQSVPYLQGSMINHL